jgi:Concanavalin A-like lectin/glucanases superfamily
MQIRRNDSQALPTFVPPARAAVRFGGQQAPYRQMIPSLQTAVLQIFTFSLFYNPDAIQPTDGGWLISKSEYFANTTNNFPVSLILGAGAAGPIPIFRISSGNDFTPELQLVAQPAIANRWNFVAGSYDGLTLLLNSNGQIQTATGAFTLSTNVLPYTLGATASEFTANPTQYRGLIYDAKIHNIAANAYTTEAIRNGFDWRQGLVVEWWRKDRPPLGRI